MSICEPPFRNTIIGCSVYPDISFQINQSSCISGKFAWGDPNIFELINPRWISPAKTQAQCSDYGNVCNDINNPQPAGVPTYTNTFIFNNHCIHSNQKLFKWTPGRWLPGQARPTSIVIGKLSRRFSNQTRIGLNLPIILSNLTKAVDTLQSLKIKSTAFCRTSYKKSLDKLICSCITGYDESFCYGKKGNFTSIGIACDEISTINTEDLTIILTNKSLPSATCSELLISSSSIVEYQMRSILPLRTLIVNYQEDSEFAIRNKNLAIYGKVLTNGYKAVFDSHISNVTICIIRSILRNNYQSDKYPILDLAKRNVKSLPDDLIPLDLKVTFNESALCAEINVLESDTLYYFIQRRNTSYEIVDRIVFPSGVIAYISIELALYSIGLILSLGRLLYSIYGSLVDNDILTRIKIRLHTILSLVASFYLFRVILFSYLLNQGLLNTSSSRAISYLLFEFPIVLFFAFVVNYICNWLACIKFAGKAIDNEGGRNFIKMLKISNYISVGLVFVIFAIFIIFIILFQTIIFEPYFICDMSILLFDTEHSRSLLLAYRITFSTISIIVGSLLCLITLIYIKFLINANLVSNSVKIKLYLISIVGGFGLIGQAIYFLIITVSDTTPNNYVSLTIILILEIIPSMLFIFIEKVEPPKNSSGDSFWKKTGSNGKSSDNLKATPRSTTHN